MSWKPRHHEWRSQNHPPARDRETYAYCLRDLGYELREAGEEAADEYASARAKDRDFKAGWLCAYIEVLSLVQDKAELFDIPLIEMCLDNLAPDTDLIRYRPGEDNQQDQKDESFFKRWFSKLRLGGRTDGPVR